MKKTLLLSCGLIAATAMISPVTAQTYKWKDKNGNIVISDTPPPPSVKAKVTGSKTAEAPAPATAAPAGQKAAPAAPQTLAEKDLDFKKRQLEAKEKAEKAAKEEEAAAQKKKACESAKQAIRTLDSSLNVSTVNEKGEPVPMDTKTRQQELENARKTAEEACK